VYAPRRLPFFLKPCAAYTQRCGESTKAAVLAPHRRLNRWAQANILRFHGRPLRKFE
jgi:hypothetical protein